MPKTTRTSVACSLLASVRGPGLTAVLMPITVPPGATLGVIPTG